MPISVIPAIQQVAIIELNYLISRKDLEQTAFTHSVAMSIHSAHVYGLCLAN